MKTNTCQNKKCGKKLGGEVHHPYYYCSITCACMDGAYNVNTGWIKCPGCNHLEVNCEC